MKGADKEGKREYTFSLQLTPGETVTLVPAASTLLFSPTSAVVTGADDCVTGVQFQAEQGKVQSVLVISKNTYSRTLRGLERP